MNIWKIPYTLRRYNPQKKKKGYVTRNYTDSIVKLNVQPVSAQVEVTEDGKRCPKRIKAFGTFPIRTVDIAKGINADRLFYQGAWYECVQSQMWEHTPLFHYESEFTLVSEAIPESDKKPPSKTDSEPAEDGGNE